MAVASRRRKKGRKEGAANSISEFVECDGCYLSRKLMDGLVDGLMDGWMDGEVACVCVCSLVRLRYSTPRPCIDLA